MTNAHGEIVAGDATAVSDAYAPTIVSEGGTPADTPGVLVDHEAGDEVAIGPGSKLGRYEILDRLGEGGWASSTRPAIPPSSETSLSR